MAKQGGLGDNFYIGSNNLSGDIGSLTNVHGGPNPGAVTGIDKSAFERIGLLRDGGLSATVWFNPTRAQPILRTLPYADQNVSYFVGQAVGNPAASLVAKQVNYDPTRGQDGSLSFALDAQATAGTGLEWGFQLTPGVRTDTTATNGTGVDRGVALASTAFGAQAYLHVFAFTGTNVTVQLQDSADNITFNNLTGGAFTLVTAVGSERIATTLTQTVRRYLRVITSGTFTNVQFAVNMIANEVAQ